MADEPIAQNDRAIKRAKGAATMLWHRFVDLVTPPLCLQCKAPVGEGAGICARCWGKLHFIEEPVCDCLGRPFAYDQGEGALSPEAIASPPAWDKARAAVAYDEASAGLVHQFKYADHHEAGLAMARMMAAAGRALLAETELVLPVPLHRFRLWQRRFNQAAFLTQHIARASSKPWRGDVLLRVRSTPPQVGLDAEARQKNLRKAFSVPFEMRPLVDGKRILLVDDVRTTGSTAEACAATLKKAGAAQVHFLSFALVLKPTRLHIVEI